MKKQIIAAAVAAAFAVPAAAQVTISGRIDNSVGSFKSSAGATTTEMRGSLITTNQIVISGAEDLGGGLKANFRVLTGFNSDTNTRTQATAVTEEGLASNTGGFDFGGRGIQVGVSGGFGSIDLGKSTGVHSNAVVVTGGFFGNQTAVSTTAASLRARPNNSITYSTPTVSGMRGQLVYGLGSEADPSTSKQTELAAFYSAGNLSLSIGHGSIADVAAAGNDVTESSAFVNYRVGNINIRGRYLATTHKTTTTSEMASYSLGVSFPLSGALSGAVEMVNLDSKATTDADFDKTAVGVFYDFSKRTNVYAVYTRQDQKLSTLQDPTVMAVGLRHNF